MREREKEREGKEDATRAEAGRASRGEELYRYTSIRELMEFYISFFCP